MDRKPCCGNCSHCDFFYEEVDGDYWEYWDCVYENPQFDYKNGICDDYKPGV